jgi:hypothetical protein
MNRRNFLLAATCACAVPLIPSAPLRASTSSAKAEDLLAIADPRYDDSLAFAEAVARDGGSVLKIAADIGTLYFNDIETRVGACALILAGLTHASDRFIVERLAGRCATRLYAGEHDWRGQASVHRFSGMMEMDQLAATFQDDGANWAQRLGEALAANLSANCPQQSCSLALPLTLTAGSPSYLTSWALRLA